MSQPCGCWADDDRKTYTQEIHYCPTHAQAPAMAACLRDLLGLIERMPNATAILTPGTTGATYAATARALLAEIEGEPCPATS